MSTTEPYIDPRVTALLVIDMQKGFCHPESRMEKSGVGTANQRAIIPDLLRLVELARDVRAAGLLVAADPLPRGRDAPPPPHPEPPGQAALDAVPARHLGGRLRRRGGAGDAPRGLRDREAPRLRPLRDDARREAPHARDRDAPDLGLQHRLLRRDDDPRRLLPRPRRRRRPRAVSPVRAGASTRTRWRRSRRTSAQSSRWTTCRR